MKSAQYTSRFVRSSLTQTSKITPFTTLSNTTTTTTTNQFLLRKSIRSVSFSTIPTTPDNSNNTSTNVTNDNQKMNKAQFEEHFPNENVEPEANFATADPLSTPLFAQSNDPKPLFVNPNSSDEARKSLYSSPTSISQILPYVKLGDRSNVNGLVVTVFGASGFIGKYVCSQFASVGSQVIVPYRGDGINVRDLRVSGELGQVVPLPYDLSDKESIRRCVSRSNIVINCIGAHYETSNFSYHDTHVKIPYRIAEVCREVGVERFVHLSPIGADPNSPSEYYKTHGMGEQVIKHFYPNATIVRASTVYGPGDHFIHRITEIGFYLWKIPTVNGGMQRHALLHVDDLAQAILAVTVREDSLGKVYELGGPNSYTFNEIVTIIGKSSFNDYRTVSLPDTAAKIYGDLMARPLYPRNPPFLARPNFKNKTIAGILDSIVNLIRKIRFPHFFHRDLVAQGYVNLVPDTRLPGMADLGIQPRTFFSTIENTVYFMQNQDYVEDEFVHAERLREQSAPRSR